MAFNPISSYFCWLHGRWPAGKVEKLPITGEGGQTNVPGIRVVGDLTGIPLLKFAADTGAKAVQAILREPGFVEQKANNPELFDLVIIGAGVAGISAAIEAQKAGLNFRIYEATQPFSTIANFPKGKPIFTYPTEMLPAGEIRFTSAVKEELIQELETQRSKAGIEIVQGRVVSISKKGSEFLLQQGDKDGGAIRCRRVIVAIGRSGNFRKLGVPGQDLDKVFNRLHDPKEFGGKNVLVVGGGDSALEAAIALGCCGANVTLSYRKKEFSRPKPENITKLRQLMQTPEHFVAIESPTHERVATAANSSMREPAVPAGSVILEMGSRLLRIEGDAVVLEMDDGHEKTIQNDAVFSMLGREAPLEFFRRSGIDISGEWRLGSALSFCVSYFLYLSLPLEIRDAVKENF